MEKKNLIAGTPEPPYYAVIFTSLKKDNNNGYEETSKRMLELAKNQEGFLGMESARDELGITVSYWRDLNSIKNWKENSEHKTAQENGKTKWYEEYKIRIAKVETDYGFKSDDQ